MAEYLFDQYIELAAEKAPELPADDSEWSKFMAALEIPELEVPEWLREANNLPTEVTEDDLLGKKREVGVAAEQILIESGLIRAALIQQEIAPDTEIMPNTNRIGNVPVSGWRIAVLTAAEHFQVHAEERSAASLPVMLGRDDSRLYVYQRQHAPGTAIAGEMRYRYIRATSSPANNAAISMGNALRVVSHNLDVEAAARYT